MAGSTIGLQVRQRSSFEPLDLVGSSWIGNQTTTVTGRHLRSSCATGLQAPQFLSASRIFRDSVSTRSFRLISAVPDVAFVGPMPATSMPSTPLRVHSGTASPAEDLRRSWEVSRPQALVASVSQ